MSHESEEAINRPNNGDLVYIKYSLCQKEASSLFQDAINYNFIIGSGMVSSDVEYLIRNMTPGESIQLDRVSNETRVIDGDDLENPSQMINIELVSITRKEELPDEVEATKKAFSTPIQRIQLSLDSKNTGNHHYYLENYQLAKTYYENSLRYLQDSEEWTSEFQKNANSLRVSVLLNISNCLNKLGDYKSVLKYCSDAIKIEKDNIKALYLRAISNMNLDDPEEARVDLYRAASIQPQNIQIRKKLSECNNIIMTRRKNKQKKDKK